MKTFVIGFVVVAAVIGSGCASAPRALGPAAHTAFNNSRVIKAITLLRNTAEAAETEGLLSRNATRCTVQAHESITKVIDATTTGWQNAVIAALDESMKNCYIEAERKLLYPYSVLARVIISEVK